MPYQILEHTADIRIKVTGDDLKALFKSAFLSMFEIMHPNPKKTLHPTTKRKIVLESPDSTSLLIDFLSEVLTKANIHKETYKEITFENLTDTNLIAQIEGIPTEQFKEDIKAVTYHEADIKKNKENNLETNIVFDI